MSVGRSPLSVVLSVFMSFPDIMSVLSVGCDMSSTSVMSVPFSGDAREVLQSPENSACFLDIVLSLKLFFS